MIGVKGTFIGQRKVPCQSSTRSPNTTVRLLAVPKVVTGVDAVSSARPPVAQWIRATDFGSVGRGFESLRAGQLLSTKVMPRHPFGTTPFRPYHCSYHYQVWIRRRFGSKARSTRTARSSR